jgi:hypothetical protein
VVQEESLKPSSPKEKGKKGKRFLGKMKDFLGGSVAVVSNATSMMTNPIGQLDKITKTKKDLIEVGENVKEKYFNDSDDDKIDFEDARD